MTLQVHTCISALWEEAQDGLPGYRYEYDVVGLNLALRLIYSTAPANRVRAKSTKAALLRYIALVEQHYPDERNELIGEIAVALVLDRIK
jgi:hypothetical protein